MSTNHRGGKYPNLSAEELIERLLGVDPQAVDDLMYQAGCWWTCSADDEKGCGLTNCEADTTCAYCGQPQYEAEAPP